MCKCFAEDKNKCIALKIKDCKGCNFFKTKQEVEEGRNKSIERINSLDNQTRNSIMDIYYNSQIL